MANQKKTTKTTKNSPAKKGPKVVSKNNVKNKTVDTKKEIKKGTVKKETVKKETIKKETVINKPKEKAQPVKKCIKEFNLTSKQKDLILILLIIVLTVIALVATTIVTSKKTPKLDIELPTILEGTAGFTEISFSEYEQKIEAKKPFIVVIVKDGCGYCEAYEPIVKEVAEEYNIPISYINLSNINENEYMTLSTTNKYLKKNKWGTPTTLLMYGSDVVETIGGYVEKDKFVSFIEKNIKVGD